MQVRTDLAMEAHKLWQESAEDTTELPGVKAQTRRLRGLEVTTVEILDKQGEEALGKPPGSYVTLELEPRRLREAAYQQRAVRLLTEQLRSLLQLRTGESVLVVGLGNTAVTPDAVGPRVLDHLLVTRHLTDRSAFSALRPVCALSPGVLGVTGLESAEIVRGVVERVRPSRIIAADALVSREPNRVCTTVQMADTGIVPGSGIANSRAAFNAQTLGVPVIAVGVPTVVDARTLCSDLLQHAGAPERVPTELLPAPGLMVTPRDIDPAINRIAALVGTAVNQALHDNLRPSELQALTYA